MMQAGTQMQNTEYKGMGTKDLIVSFATNASFPDLARFLLSARKFCSVETTDIVLFVEPKHHQFSELASELRVTLIPVSSLWREISGNLVLKVLYRGLLVALKLGADRGSPAWEQVYRATVSSWVHAMCGRHLAYQDFLKANSIYRCVLLSDSRDVVFQSNPFGLVNPNVLNVFEQDRSLLFGGDNCDTNWFAKVYGRELVNTLSGKQTICAGTIMGSPAIFLKYLDFMEQEVLSHKFCPLDQAMHNKIVYCDFPRELLEFHSNLSGLIFTMGETSESDYQIEGNQLTLKNKIVSVLHQYDRVPKIRSEIEKAYPLV